MRCALDDYRWLVSPEGRTFLPVSSTGNSPVQAGQTSLSVAAGEASLPARLRKLLSPQQARLVREQIELRRRAQEKFPEAGRMFFTAVGLQQATDAPIAAYKAARFACGEPVGDLCCGIGGDLLALARRGPVVGIERDPATALLAEANLHACGIAATGPEDRHSCLSDLGRFSPSDSLGPRAGQCGPAAIRVQDVAQISVGELAAWHIDPDRRPQGRRTVRLERQEPGLDIIRRLLAENPAGAVKLAPAAQVPPDWQAEAELEWISRARECRQLVGWFGSLASHGGARRATMVRWDVPPGTSGPSTESAVGAVPHRVVRTIAGKGDEPLPVLDRIGRFLYDPDPAVLGAGLLGVLAGEHGLAAVAPGSVYLTADRAVADPAVACFEVAEVLPFDLKRVKAALRQRGVGRLEIKKRGVKIDPEQVRRRLGLRGEGAAVLVLVRLGRGVAAVLARRVA